MKKISISVLYLTIALIFPSIVIGGVCDGISLQECAEKGIASIKSGNYSDGRTFLKEVLAKQADNYKARYWLGVDLCKIGEMDYPEFADEGIQELTKTIPFVKTPEGLSELYRVRGECFLGKTKSNISRRQSPQNNYQLAAGDFSKAIELTPEKANLYYNRYLCKNELGFTGPALLEDLKRAAELGHEEAQANLSTIELPDRIKKQQEEERKAAAEAVRKEDEELKKQKEKDKVSIAKVKLEIRNTFKDLPQIIDGFNRTVSNKEQEMRVSMLVSSVHCVVVGTYLSCLYQDVASCATNDAQYRELTKSSVTSMGAAKERIQYSSREIQEDLMDLHKAVLKEYFKSPSRMIIASDPGCRKKFSKK